MTNQVKNRINALGYEVKELFTKDGINYALVLTENEDVWNVETKNTEIFARIVDVNSENNFPAMNIVIYDVASNTIRELEYYNDNFDFKFKENSYSIIIIFR